MGCGGVLRRLRLLPLAEGFFWRKLDGRWKVFRVGERLVGAGGGLGCGEAAGTGFSRGVVGVEGGLCVDEDEGLAV